MSNRMPLFEFIRDGERQLAVILRRGQSGEKYNFATEGSSALQLGVTFYEQDDKVAPHAHHPRNTLVRDCHEFVLVQDGALEVCVFHEDGSLISKFELGPGEAVLFQDGGHSLRCLEATQIIEVKQGPYVNAELDKYPLNVDSNDGPAS